jgi:hypothetical protein
MRIGISINEVLRDFLSQFEYTYNKYYVKDSSKEISIRDNPVDSFELEKHFPFESVDAMNEFLYREGALEIFGHADQLYKNLFAQLNLFIMDMNDEEEHVIELVSREAINSIPSTFFFLSKTLCRAENIRFVTRYEDKWDGLDVLITANPRALAAKPEGKIAIKVNCTYNQDSEADFTIDDIRDFITDEGLRDKILSTTTTNYEEID